MQSTNSVSSERLPPEEVDVVVIGEFIDRERSQWTRVSATC